MRYVPGIEFAEVAALAVPADTAVGAAVVAGIVVVLAAGALAGIALDWGRGIALAAAADIVDYSERGEEDAFM